MFKTIRQRWRDMDALRSVGIAVADDVAIASGSAPVPPHTLPRSAPSGQALMKTLIHGVDGPALAEAAKAEIGVYRS